MAEMEPPVVRFHEDPDLFRAALGFTAAETLFPARLIEKDYFCTLLLTYVCGAAGRPVFKGGTCLAKVHGDFYRLSEDLDFVMPMPVTASRSQRSRQVIGVRSALDGLAERLPCFRVTEPLTGANDSAQYFGAVSYSSWATGQEESIAVQISLREPLLTSTVDGSVRTMLLDPISGQRMVPPVTVPCIARMEAFAEKCRAALTRRDVAIRDFYDLDYAVRELGIQPQDARLIKLVRGKLAVPGNEPVNLGPDRLAQLRGQLVARLKPVLRESDFAAFDLDRAFGLVCEVADQLSD